jgi:hypothetical protein
MNSRKYHGKGKRARAELQAFFASALVEGRSFDVSCWVCRTRAKFPYAIRWSVGERACQKCGADLNPPRKVASMWEISNHPKVRDHGANCVERNGKGLCKAQGGRRPDQVGRRPLGEVSLGRRFRR